VVAAVVAGLASRSGATHDPAEHDLGLALSLSQAMAGAVAQAAPSIVSVNAVGGGEQSYGAGIVVAPEGEVVTALHVVRGATAIGIRLADGAEFAARLVAVDPEIDVALLRILAPNRTFTPARLGDDEGLRVGECVLAVGNPFDLAGSVSFCVLSGRDRTGVVDGNAAPLLQTDAAINPGSSGGALLNLHGEVVGMVDAILTRTGSHQGVAFAVPARELAVALPALREGRTPERPWIGLRVSRATDGGPGLSVTSVVPGGPGAAAGVEAGDRLLRLAGEAVVDLPRLRRILRGARSGRPLRVALLRDGEAVETQLTPAPKKP